MRIENIRFELRILNSNLHESENFNRIQMRIKFFSKKNFDWIAQLFNQTSFDVNAKRIFFNRISMFCILLLWSNALHRRDSIDLWTRDVFVMIKSLLIRSLSFLRWINNSLKNNRFVLIISINIVRCRRVEVSSQFWKFSR
jgi:hypothetical protein